MTALKIKVREYEKKIQKIINEHKYRILNKFDGEFFSIERGEIIPKNFGLDLGFFNINTTNPEIKEAKRILYNAKEHQFKWLDIELPYEPQSLTIKTKIFDEVKRIVEEETGEELIGEAMLD